MDILPLVVLLFCTTEARARVTLSPTNLTVVRGDEARFTCTVQNTQWTVMTWMMNGGSVATISKNLGVLPSLNPNVTAQKSKEDSWVLVLKSTEKENQGQVTCDVQHVEIQTTFLFVQEKGNVIIQGDSRLAYIDSLVWFQCRAAGWFPQPFVEWRVDGKKVKQKQHSESSWSSVEMVGSLFTVTTNLTVKAVKSTRVDCLASVSALPAPLKSSVNLTVVAEVLGEAADRTDLMILSACLAALLLLLLVCISTVLCYRRRTQAKDNLQEVIRFDQSGPEGITGATGGTLNLGYSSEGTANEDGSLGHMEAHSQSSYASFHHIPDVVDASSMFPPYKRHATKFQQQESRSNSSRAITTV
ncbi:immunoglobulin superfamily member 5 isoform X2 [Oryzias latipes]|uniref:immunoglobulin superfamily member 5 isoform X2 n=1 Tax=Oryzias latipes TaxID=8090 RepID=UPI0002A4B8A8|nr:immunoglobulin superfamily member 5 isoform X2 [Oryzias latipes]